MNALLARIQQKQAPVAVVGGGYLGVPLAVALAKIGFSTTVFDRSIDKIASLNRGQTSVTDVHQEDLRDVVAHGILKASNDADVLDASDVVIVCADSAAKRTRDPDHQQVVDVAQLIGSRLRSEKLVVLESTILPGFTRQQFIPRLESRGLQEGKDFFVAVAPARTDPRRSEFTTKDVPRVIGANSVPSERLASALYAHLTSTIVAVSDTDTAEMAKFLETSFRSVNSAVANEMLTLCRTMGVDIWEVIEAASTKPFGFTAFYPGPGISGRGIAPDSSVFMSNRRPLGTGLRLLDLADSINSERPEQIVEGVREALNDRKRALRGARILIVGVSYKSDVGDTFDSPALDIIQMLHLRGTDLAYLDPYVEELSPLSTQGALSIPVPRATIDSVKTFDCVVILAAHECIDYPRLVADASLIVDARNATSGLRHRYSEKIYCT